MIRLSKSGDLPYLAAVEKSAAKKFHAYLGAPLSGDEVTLPGDILEQAHQGKSLWIAEDNNEIIGFIAATFFENNLHIEELSVAFEHQGKGAGKALINTAISAARKLQCKAVSLTTNSELPWTYPFYARLGFKEVSPSACSPALALILERDKKSSITPESRVAMILSLTKQDET